MSQNDTIRKSDKKFIRKEKARIRRQFSDSKKQEEMINELYKRFSAFLKVEGVKEIPVPKVEVKKTVVKKEEPKKEKKAHSVK